MTLSDTQKEEAARLLDTFGGTLTAKQREYCEMYFSDDLSLSEIAENVGITAVGVRDIIIRAVKKLRGMERDTGICGLLDRIYSAAETLPECAEKTAILNLLQR